MQCTEHGDGRDRRTCQVRCHVGRNAGQPQHVDVQGFTRQACLVQNLPGVVTQAEVQTLAADRLADDVRVPLKLVPDGSPDEIRSIRVEAISDEQVDVA